MCLQSGSVDCRVAAVACHIGTYGATFYNALCSVSPISAYPAAFYSHSDVKLFLRHSREYCLSVSGSYFTAFEQHVGSESA